MSTKYQFGEIEKRQRSSNKPTRKRDDKGWRRLTWIVNE